MPELAPILASKSGMRLYQRPDSGALLRLRLAAALLAAVGCRPASEAPPVLGPTGYFDSRTKDGPGVEVKEDGLGVHTGPLDPQRCVQALLEREVAFVPLRYSKGVTTPVQIEGPIGGVVYRARAGFRLVVDCRFALALAEAGPRLRRHGVTTLDFSIAHAYRNTHAGALSLHANGLAVDLHAASFEDGTAKTVKEDYVRHLGAGRCAEALPSMNQVACEFERTGFFSQVLTPDHDPRHADHFHLAMARRP